MIEATPNFGMAAWPAYVECVRNGGYYFAVDELVAMCAAVNVNVLVFEQLQEVLVFANGYFGGPNEPICCKLPSGRDGAVRSHFERLVGEPVLSRYLHTP